MERSTIWLAQVLEPVAGLADHALQHGANRQELTQFTGLFGTPGEADVREVLAIAGDQACVHGIGLGQDASGLGEAADTGGIEQLDEEALGFQSFDDAAFVIATGLQGDPGDAGLIQAAAQFGQAPPVAADGEGETAGQNVDVELVFADVDAGDTYNVVHLRDPFLACGLADRAAVRALRSDDPGSKLSCGVCKGSYRDLNGLRTVDAGGVGSSSRVSAHSSASPQTCKDLTLATEAAGRSARSFAALRTTG